jgi:hypothetical protein
LRSLGSSHVFVDTLVPQVGAEYAVSLAEQERQVEALKALEYGLGGVARERNADLFEGLTVQVSVGITGKTGC